MKNMKYKTGVQWLLATLMILAVSGCGRIAGDSNFTLYAGESVSGTLFILSQNADLVEGSSVDGSVIMLCCNLIVDGKVNGDVYLLTGNLKIDAHADVDGDVGIMTGNLSR